MRDSAERLLKVLDEFVIAEEHASETQAGRPLAASTGLSIYLPTDYGYDPQGSNPIDNVPVGGTHGYENQSFALQTHWDELLKLISKDDDHLGKHPRLARFLERAANYVKLAGYEEAKNVLLGKKAVEPVSFLGFKIPIISDILGYFNVGVAAIGGAFKALKGIDKLLFTLRNREEIDSIDPNLKLEAGANALIDTIVGVGSAAIAAGLFMGIGSAFLPVAGVVLGLGVGRFITEVYRGYRKFKRSQNMTVTQKLEFVDKHKHVTQNP